METNANNDYIDDYILECEREAEDAAKSFLIRLKESMSEQEYNAYIEGMKKSALREAEKNIGIESESYVFDFDENNYQVLILEKHVNKNILGIIPTTLRPYYFIYAEDLENPENDSKVFYYYAFFEELKDVVKEKGFEDFTPTDLRDLFKFMKTPKRDVEQNLCYPTLELVFDKPNHEIYASLSTDDQIFLEDVSFKELNEECKKLGNTPIPKIVTPTLRKFDKSF